VFLDFISGLRKSLEAAYASDAGMEEKLARKAEIIKAAETEYREKVLPLFKSDAYKGADDLPLNNAYISLFDLYTKDIPLLKDFYARACGSDLAVFIQKIKEMARTSKDAAAAIRSSLGADK
jgi:predicted aminopeptidase